MNKTVLQGRFDVGEDVPVFRASGEGKLARRAPGLPDQPGSRASTPRSRPSQKAMTWLPSEMIAKGAPRVIHNDAELQAYTEALFELTALKKPSKSEADTIELLTLLIERYEQAHYPIPAASPVSVVRFLIERQGLTQRDLVPQFGSESAVSMFLSGQRKLSLGQIRKLSARFKLPADVFTPNLTGYPS